MSRKKNPRLVLNDKEIDILDTIATRSKMDCWFGGITTHKEKDGTRSDWVFDCENNRKVTLRYGVSILYEGMTKYKDYNLTKTEISTFKNLLKKLNIELHKAYMDDKKNGF